MVMNKKGQELTLGTIVLIVLGVVVLVFLIYGFSTGWGNLWSRITGLGGGDVNVDTIKTSCELACQQQNKYSFCDQKRTVILEKGVEGDFTCNDLTAEVDFGTATASNKKTIGISKSNCPNLC